MIRDIENALLATPLDFDGHVLRNPGQFLPVPAGLLDTDDPRLSDPRTILDDSVTDLSVNVEAAIAQSKLLFNGTIPTEWLGTGEHQAARGDLAERVHNKGLASGYAGLDGEGKVLIGDMPSTGPGAGTVTRVGLSLPKEFNPVADLTAAGPFSVTWVAPPDNTYFGVNGTGPKPSFLTAVLPVGLIPDLDATKFTSGVFPVEQLPVAVALGVDHARGLLPDPGGGEETGHETDYLGRDMTWKTLRFVVPYQPFLPDVQITLIDFSGIDDQGGATWPRIQILCPNNKASLFYQVLNPQALPPIIPPFNVAPSNPVLLTVNPGFTVQAYAAKIGWNNSPMNKYMAPTQPETH